MPVITQRQPQEILWLGAQYLYSNSNTYCNLFTVLSPIDPPSLQITFEKKNTVTNISVKIKNTKCLERLVKAFIEKLVIAGIMDKDGTLIKKR